MLQLKRRASLKFTLYTEIIHSQKLFLSKYSREPVWSFTAIKRLRRDEKTFINQIIVYDAQAGLATNARVWKFKFQVNSSREAPWNGFDNQRIGCWRENSFFAVFANDINLCTSLPCYREPRISIRREEYSIKNLFCVETFCRIGVHRKFRFFFVRAVCKMNQMN